MTEVKKSNVFATGLLLTLPPIALMFGIYNLTSGTILWGVASFFLGLVAWFLVLAFGALTYAIGHAVLTVDAREKKEHNARKTP